MATPEFTQAMIDGALEISRLGITNNFHFEPIYNRLPEYQFDFIKYRDVVDTANMHIIAARHHIIRTDDPLLPILAQNYLESLLKNPSFTHATARAIQHLIPRQTKLELFLDGRLTIEECDHFQLTEEQVITWLKRCPAAILSEKIRVINCLVSSDAFKGNAAFARSLPRDLQIIYATCTFCRCGDEQGMQFDDLTSHLDEPAQ